MNCSFSGEPAEDPVLDPTTGKIYSLAAVKANQGLASLPSDLDSLIKITVDPAIKPKLPTATSLPSLLSLFQQEWDATALECHLLKKKLYESNCELATALYENDAAKRVIARLIKECSDAKNQMEKLVSAEGVPEHSAKKARIEAQDEMQVDSIFEPALLTLVEETAKRRKRKAPPSLASADAVKEFSLSKLNSTHAAGSPKSHGGITVFDLAVITLFDIDYKLLLGGSKDGKVTVRNVDGSDSVQLLTNKAHKGSVTVLSWADQGKFLSGGKDGKVKIFTPTHEKKGLVWKETSCLEFNQPILAINIHPSNSLALICTAKEYTIVSLADSSKLTSKAAEEIEFTSSCIHPDGLILAISTSNSTVLVYDFKILQVLATFTHKAPQTHLSFSENGYFLASASPDGVSIWDLRSQSLNTFISGENVNYVEWDRYGAYLAVGQGDDVVVYLNKKWTLVGRWEGVGSQVWGIKWGPDAEYFICSGGDGKYSVFGAGN